MAVADSKIEWTDSTWSPVTGCTKVSPGCDHCYAETFAERWRGVPGHAYEQGFDLKLWPSVKQMGSVWARRHGVGHKGGVLEDMPEDLRVREMPT